jgi:hypothetical protein
MKEAELGKNMEHRRRKNKEPIRVLKNSAIRASESPP